MIEMENKDRFVLTAADLIELSKKCKNNIYTLIAKAAANGMNSICFNDIQNYIYNIPFIKDKISSYESDIKRIGYCSIEIKLNDLPEFIQFVINKDDIFELEYISVNELIKNGYKVTYVISSSLYCNHIKIEWSL